MVIQVLNAGFVRQARCPAGKRKVDYFDRSQTGFLLEVRATGGKTFYQRYTDSRGKERQIKIGPAGLMSLGRARLKGREILLRALLGGDPYAERQIRRHMPTLNEFVRDSYLPHVKSYKRSWQTDETMLRVHILPALGALHLDELQPADIAALLSRLRSDGYAPGTVGRAIVILRFLFNLAKKWKVPGLSENPTAPFKVPADVERSRYLTSGEVSRLISAIEADENHTAGKAIRLLLLTGARRNEVTHAQWSFVDFERKTLLVPKSKSGKPRYIRLSTDAIELLRSVQKFAENPYIFPAPRTGKPMPHLHFPWGRIRKRAGLTDVRLHDLRHSFASFLVNSGKDLYVVQKMLGHENPRTTQRYAHLSADTLDDAAEVVSLLVSSSRIQSK